MHGELVRRGRAGSSRASGFPVPGKSCVSSLPPRPAGEPEGPGSYLRDPGPESLGFVALR